MGVEAVSLLGLEKTSLRQQALTALRRAITTGEIPPGKHLVETELSEMLNISRGTLREALRQLQQEGLVSAGARGRLSVRNLDAKEIRDIFAVRAALETLAAQQLCTLEDRSDAVAQLQASLKHMGAEAGHGIERGIEADLEFHRVLCRLTGNEPLLHSWEQLEGSIRMSIMWGGTERGIKNMNVKRHAEIVDAIASADAGLAATVIKEHMDSAANVLVTT
ncbi:GntR family transcriptional regulator [Paeniglutamicibacter sp. ABSL32-1]|uniref:GntR family transcriptional regulator n=1 Tax=Paeniglutamicibacter quisquiliarum TaxID=2849498 RepID=UPI001C2CE258|nr:GntR family transcriptional regulator [Paeniglutamicibacter quisquiliarum]MBV1780239.1 GntR family transcriptional regulator [Paeniglutamicibacter quisquiliarum]